MKKLLLLVALVLSAGLLNAHTITISNRTEETLDVDATFGGAGVCSTENFQVVPDRVHHKEFTKSVGGCCLKMLIVRGRRGTRTVQGHLTGFGISCRSNRFVVKDNPAGAPIVELK